MSLTVRSILFYTKDFRFSDKAFQYLGKRTVKKVARLETSLNDFIEVDMQPEYQIIEQGEFLENVNEGVDRVSKFDSKRVM